jgi:DNA repair protein RadC
MADMDSTAPPMQRTRNRPRKAREAFPAYGAGAGVLSFRHGLAVYEREVIDQALAIVGRCLRQPGMLAADPSTAREYIRLHIGGEPCEVFCAMYLDAQNRVIAFDRLFNGTLSQTSVYPRELVHATLMHGATAVILAHNHPSGSLQPSRADRALTDTIKSALALVDVRVLDHVIVGRDKTLSMAEMGLL